MHATLNAWQRWEQGERQMSSVLFEAYQLRTGQHPSHVLVSRENFEHMFTPAEWNALRDILNGSIIDQPLLMVERSLPEEWLDAVLDGADRKWGLDAREFNEKLRRLDQPEAAAVIQAVRQWWTEQ